MFNFVFVSVAYTTPEPDEDIDDFFMFTTKPETSTEKTHSKTHKMFKR